MLLLISSSVQFVDETGVEMQNAVFDWNNLKLVRWTVLLSSMEFVK